MTANRVDNTPDKVPFLHKRHLFLTLNLEADDYDEMVRSLEQFALDLIRGEHRGGDGLSAGWASSHSWRIVVDDDMDGERYRGLLKEWDDARRGKS